MLSDSHKVTGRGVGSTSPREPCLRAEHLALAGKPSLGLLGNPGTMEQQGKGQISGTEERLEATGFRQENQGEDWRRVGGRAGWVLQCEKV